MNLVLILTIVSVIAATEELCRSVLIAHEEIKCVPSFTYYVFFFYYLS
jgi:hypothetical protein